MNNFDFRLWDLSKRRSSCQVFPSVQHQRLSINRELNHPAFQSIRIEQVLHFSLYVYFSK